MFTLNELLNKSSERHDHLCPRQVIGVRMGVKAATYLDFELPQVEKRLLTFVETDGCFADGVEVSTGCSIGHRTLRVQDYGKVAATFVDTVSKSAIRIAPHRLARYNAIKHSHGAQTHWEAMLLGYQKMSNDELFSVQSVQLKMDIDKIISRAGIRVQCELCEEEIINEREIIDNGIKICRSCTGDGYYDADNFALPATLDSPILPRSIKK